MMRKAFSGEAELYVRCLLRIKIGMPGQRALALYMKELAELVGNN